MTTGSLSLQREMTVERLCSMWGLCVSVCRIGARCLHGDMPQNAREQALDGFRTGVWEGGRWDGAGECALVRGARTAGLSFCLACTPSMLLLLRYDSLGPGTQECRAICATGVWCIVRSKWTFWRRICILLTLCSPPTHLATGRQVQHACCHRRRSAWP